MIFLLVSPLILSTSIDRGVGAQFKQTGSVPAERMPHRELVDNAFPFLTTKAEASKPVADMTKVAWEVGEECQLMIT